MASDQKLFSVGNFDFKIQHLLVIGVLVLSFSISMLIRATPMMYGLDLFEFDPYFNYRATDHMSIININYYNSVNYIVYYKIIIINISNPFLSI